MATVRVARVLGQIHRVGRGGATAHVTVSHFSSANAFTDPLHRHGFGSHSFDPFVESNGHTHALARYRHTRFRRVSRTIHFHPSLLNKVVWRSANRRLDAYEHCWARMFPTWFLSVRLEVVKHSP
jgi:hypothetical protein